MNLKKKIGPLPLWAWVLIVGTTVGLLWYEHSKNASSSSSTTSSSSSVDPATGLTYAQEQQEEQAGIDPFTGQSYASEQPGYGWGGVGSTDYPGGGGVTDTSTSPPSWQQELSDVVGGIQALEQAGLISAPGSSSNGSSSSSGAGAKSTKKKTTETAAGGIKITNFKPKGTKTTTVKGIGHGLYESIPKTTSKKLNTKTVKTKSTSGKKKTVSTHRQPALVGGRRT